MSVLDLVVLVPDIDIENAINILLSERSASLSLREFTYKILRYSGRDSGCFRDSPEFLRAFSKQYAYAMVVFDLHGSGAEAKGRAGAEEDLESRLAINGWKDRCAAVVIDPEIEAWVWSASPEVDRVLGFGGTLQGVKSWLIDQGEWGDGSHKPSDPKRAMELALKESRIPRSPSNFAELARVVGLRKCEDMAFNKFKRVLRGWFPSA